MSRRLRSCSMTGSSSCSDFIRCVGRAGVVAPAVSTMAPLRQTVWVKA